MAFIKVPVNGEGEKLINLDLVAKIESDKGENACNFISLTGDIIANVQLSFAYITSVIAPILTTADASGYEILAT